MLCLHVCQTWKKEVVGTKGRNECLDFSDVLGGTYGEFVLQSNLVRRFLKFPVELFLAGKETAEVNPFDGMLSPVMPGVVAVDFHAFETDLLENKLLGPVPRMRVLNRLFLDRKQVHVGLFR
jgi:hypothetical protein